MSKRRQRDQTRRDAEGNAVSGRIHKCDVCGKEEAWGPTWTWFGSYRDLDDNNPIEKMCSEECQENRHLIAHQRARDRLAAELAQQEIDLTAQLERVRAARLRALPSHVQEAEK